MLLVLPLISSPAVRHYSRNAKIGYEKFLSSRLRFLTSDIKLDPFNPSVSFCKADWRAKTLNFYWLEIITKIKKARHLYSTKMVEK